MELAHGLNISVLSFENRGGRHRVTRGAPEPGVSVKSPLQPGEEIGGREGEREGEARVS